MYMASYDDYLDKITNEYLNQEETEEEKLERIYELNFFELLDKLEEYKDDFLSDVYSLAEKANPKALNEILKEMRNLIITQGV